jgi:hypothetical protein
MLELDPATSRDVRKQDAGRISLRWIVDGSLPMLLARKGAMAMPQWFDEIVTVQYSTVWREYGTIPYALQRR